VNSPWACDSGIIEPIQELDGAKDKENPGGGAKVPKLADSNCECKISFN
jgi:hypothetical protein